MFEEAMFEVFKNKMMEKFKKEDKKHGDSWLRVFTNELIEFMGEHINKFYNNRNAEKGLEREDLIDIAIYCAMIWYKMEDKKHVQ